MSDGCTAECEDVYAGSLLSTKISRLSFLRARAEAPQQVASPVGCDR